MRVKVARMGRFPFGAYGKLYVTNCDTQFSTVERPWLDNERSISCIPAGTYPLVLGEFRRNTADPSDDYPCFEIHDVPGRNLIKIHVANRPDQVQGCIAIGLGFGVSNGVWSVIHSRAAHQQFMEAMGSHVECEIEIAWGW